MAVILIIASLFFGPLVVAGIAEYKKTRIRENLDVAYALIAAYLLFVGFHLVVSFNV